MRGEYVSYAIIYAANHGHIDVVEYLRHKDGVDFNAKNIYDETALTSAVSGHRLEMVKYLVQIPGIDVNGEGPNGNSPFLAAAVTGDVDILKFLATVPGVNIHARNSSDFSALKLARMYKHPAAIAYLESLQIEE